MSARAVFKGPWVEGLERRGLGNLIAADGLFAAQLRMDVRGRPEWLDLQLDVAGRGVVQLQLDFETAVALSELIDHLRLEAEKQALGGASREG